MTLAQPEIWGHLRERFENEQPRRLLSLDGGGIRGVLSLQVLAKIESELRGHYGDPDLRLCQFFDYIGGTSTGAIVAAGLARGFEVQEAMDFYEDFGAQVFTRRRWGLWKSLYQNGPLQKTLMKVYGKHSDLRPENLESLLLVVTRNSTTDSAWPISSNPAAKYNDLDRSDCNLNIPIWQLVRASTAAPIYFPPEVVEWDATDPSKSFVFVDGGTTSYNNPAFLMSKMATEPAYKLGWRRGEKNMLIVSVGTGNAPNHGAVVADPESNLASSAANTLLSLMSQAAFDQDVSCRTVGRCAHGPFIDREVLDLIPRDGKTGDAIPLATDLGRNFLYSRYDAELTQEGLGGLGLGEVDAEEVSKLDSVDGMADLKRIGQRVAEDFSLEHLGSFLDVPVHPISNRR